MGARETKKTRNLKSLIDYIPTFRREGCSNCAFVELKPYPVSRGRGKQFYCQMHTIFVSAGAICKSHVRKERS